LASLAWHSLFYHVLEYLVILTHCECLYQVDSNILMYSLSSIFEVSIFSIALVRSGEVFFLLNIPNNSLLFILNESFHDINVDG